MKILLKSSLDFPALHDKDCDLVIQRAGVMLRGCAAVEKEAVAICDSAVLPELWHDTDPSE